MSEMVSQQITLSKNRPTLLLFWITKLIVTGIGGWIALMLSQFISQSVTLLLTATILIHLLKKQHSKSNSHSIVYWLMVGLAAAVGTTIANILNLDFGIGSLLLISGYLVKVFSTAYLKRHPEFNGNVTHLLLIENDLTYWLNLGFEFTFESAVGTWLSTDLSLPVLGALLTADLPTLFSFLKINRNQVTFRNTSELELA